jgi:hypothetical protein
MRHSFCRQVKAFSQQPQPHFRHDRGVCKDSPAAVTCWRNRASRLQLAAGSLDWITLIPPVHTTRCSTVANEPGAVGAHNRTIR